MKRWAALLLGGVLAGSMGSAVAQLGEFGGIRKSNNYQEPETEPWRELEVQPPAFPREENLREFYVSAVATNKYFIDASTLSVEKDGVVRYVLVVKTSGGATNVSFEGIQCEQRAWKHYATGHGDGTWTKARAQIDWRPIENKPVNRHHAALSRDFFCPVGAAIGTADEGRNALRLGKHPNAN
jgi:hypothetical protein